MRIIQKGEDPLLRFFRSRRRVVFLVIAVVSTLVAIAWVLSDFGYIGDDWGRLALIFFTWLTGVLAAWTLLRVKE